MALLDISLVTKVIIKLIRLHVKESSAWTGVDEPTVSPMPPDLLKGDVLGVYLYHITEDSHFKNLSSPGNDQPPVRYAPMALNLNYQLCAQSASEDDSGFYQAQLLLGLAVKALHDFPTLTDATKVNGEELFEDTGLEKSDNRFHISLQPIAHTEAGNFWSAGSLPVRLSTYYQVSVALLEPEESVSRASRVLTYGVYPFVSGEPHFDGNENTLIFDIPDVATSQEVKLRPAEVPLGGTVTFTGSNLTAEETLLFLNNSSWDKPCQANGNWRLHATQNRVTVEVQENIQDKPVIPGVYTAFVQVIRHLAISSGEVRSFEHRSNATPFTITPKVSNISALDGDGVFIVTGSIFQHDDLDSKNVQVHIAANRYSQQEAAPLQPGEFVIVNATTLQCRLLAPEGTTPGTHLPVRVLVNGAESPPNWIRVP
jgi:hypothetical protein